MATQSEHSAKLMKAGLDLPSPSTKVELAGSKQAGKAAGMLVQAAKLIQQAMDIMEASGDGEENGGVDKKILSQCHGASNVCSNVAYSLAYAEW